jgi:hypothetical protein
VRTVDVRGVDEVDSGVDDGAQQGDRAVTVGVLAPHLLARQLHRAEADPADDEVATDGDDARHGAPFLVGRARATLYRNLSTRTSSVGAFTRRTSAQPMQPRRPGRHEGDADTPTVAFADRQPALGALRFAPPAAAMRDTDKALAKQLRRSAQKACTRS